MRALRGDERPRAAEVSAVRTIRTRWRLGVALLALVAAVAGLSSAPSRRGYEALLLLADLVEQPLPSVLDARPAAERRTIDFESGPRRYRGDLYRPEAPARAGIVFVPGAAEQGKDDPRVVRFGMALARAGFSVLVPDVVALRQLRLLPESAEDVGDALSWMGSRPALVPEGRLGLATTSVAIGPGLLALLDRPEAAAVAFVVSIGGYYDLPRTLAYLTTGQYDAMGVSVQRAPKEYGKWVYALSTAVRLEDPEERQAFEALAWRRFRDPEADISAELARCGPAARTVYAFIANTDPGLSDELLRRLPRPLQDDLTALDLASLDLSRVQARFILVHGIDDDMIPYGESVALAGALSPGQARLFLIEGFEHVDLGPVLGGWRMWRAIDALLRERAR